MIGWGSNEKGQLNIPDEAKSGVIAICAGMDCSFAIKEDGSVIGWGTNVEKRMEIPAEAQSDVIAIAAGRGQCLALKKGGRVIKWGEIGLLTDPPADTQEGVTAIDASPNFSMALKEGRVLTWGLLGIEKSNLAPPAITQSGVSAIAAGFYHALALKEGKVVAWGDNDNGECGVPEEAQSDVIAIAGGVGLSVALKKDGRVILWGDKKQHFEEVKEIPSLAQSRIFNISSSYCHVLALRAPIQR